MLLTEGFKGGVFWDRLNVHTFNLESRRLYKAGGFNRRADRRVQGWLRRDGWMEGWVEGKTKGFIKPLALGRREKGSRYGRMGGWVGGKGRGRRYR